MRTLEQCLREVQDALGIVNEPELVEDDGDVREYAIGFMNFTIVIKEDGWNFSGYNMASLDALEKRHERIYSQHPVNQSGNF